MANFPLKYGVFLIISFWYLVLLITGCGQGGALSDVRVIPYTATVGLNKTQQFSAVGHDSSGAVVSMTPIWSIFGSLGTIDAHGLFYSGPQTGTTYVIATASGTSIAGQATVTITDKGSISGKVRNHLSETVSGITVRIATDHSKSTQSNSSGNYSLSDLSEGTYSVETVATTRYLSSSGEATVTMGQGATLNLTLNGRLSIVSSILSRVGYTMNITGAVKNNGSTAATSCTVFYLFYDAENLPLGSGSTSLGTIQAGSTEAFIMSVMLSKEEDPSRTVSYAIPGGF